MRHLLAALDAEGGETRYVGGCVRDTLLGLPVSDVDLATRLPPEEVIKRLKRAGIKAVPTGLAHGTITAVLRDGPVEVTTLRRDVSTDGRRATVAFTEDWQEDAARRDFTMNALSADPVSHHLFDYFGGQDDLAAGRVRFIGDAFQRIAEDHLRILRFFRFHARFGRGLPDDLALQACTARANDLMALSRERIADELLKLLGLPAPVATVELMVASGIFRPVLPEIDQESVERLARLIANEAAVGADPDRLRRLAALIPPDPGIATGIAARLRLSNKATKRLVLAAEWPNSPPRDPRRLAYRIGSEGAMDHLLLGEGEDLHTSLAALADWKRPRLGIGGGDLIAMGVAAGPAVSTLLRAIEEEWAEAGFPENEAVVQAIAKQLVDQWLRANR